MAQLCLLLAVLVFLGLTRGSRPPEALVTRLGTKGPGLRPESRGLKGWGRRHLSLTGHYWTGQWGEKSSEKIEGEFESSNESRNRSRSQTREGRVRTPANRPKPLVLKPYPIAGTFMLKSFNFSIY